jgi:hypothetical protein
MPLYSTCAFCQRDDSPLTREHVFADWIAREFPDARWSRIDTAIGKVIPFKNSLGLVIRKVCKRCNTGWMHKLESTAKPILIPLMHAEKRGTVTEAEQSVITKWLIKTMLAYDLAAKRIRAPFFTPDDRRMFAESLSVPADTEVYLAQYRGSMGHVLTLESHTRPTQETLPQQYQDLVDMHVYTGTFVIKHIALQFFTFKRTKNVMGKRLNFIINPAWDTAVFRLLPSVSVVDWPPPTLLEDAQLKAFATRWASADLAIS